MIQSASHAMLLLLILGLILTSYGQHLHRQAMHNNNSEAIHSTKSAEVLSYLNLTADPCEDFFEFACGNWIRKHQSHVHRDSPTATPASLLQLRLNKDLQLMLESSPNAQHQSSRNMQQDLLRGMHQNPVDMMRMKGFYSSCMAAKSNSAEQQTFLQSFIREYGGLPSIAGSWKAHLYNWIDVLARLRLNYGIEILIGLDIDKQLQGQRTNTIYITEPHTTLLPVNLCSMAASAMAVWHERDYEQLQQEVCRNMQKWFQLSHADANRIAGDIIRFEFRICSHMRAKDSTPSPNAVDDTLQQQTSRTGGHSRIHGYPEPAGVLRQTPSHLTQQYGNVIDFRQFINTIFESSINDPIYMRADSYFASLTNILKENNKLTLAHYIMYRAVQALQLPTDDRRDKRAHYCVGLIRTFFPKQLGAMYQQHYFSTEAQHDIDSIFPEIVRSLQWSLRNDWLGDNSRSAIEQKLLLMKATFPYYAQSQSTANELDSPDITFWQKIKYAMKLKSKEELSRLFALSDFNMPGSELDTVEATDIAMRAYPMKNRIIVGGGLMHAPFFNVHYPKAVKFSFLGQQLARELISAVSDQSLYANSVSPLRWDDHTLQRFHNRTECFRQQYSNYLFNRPDVFRNSTKLRELMAESAGIRVAFNAYLAWLEQMLPVRGPVLSKETLQDVNYTNTQLFFINFAQTRCAAKYIEHTDQKLRTDFLPMDKHSDERYMVNGPLSNFIEFAREFGCKPGTAMNIDDKCVVY